MQPIHTRAAPLLFAAAFAAPATAQAPAFQTPGMPAQVYEAPAASAESGQTSRFTSSFNPAFSFVIDTLADYIDYDGSGDDDGFDTELRTLEFAGQSWVDPSAWAYFVAASDGDSVDLEEAAIHYTGLDGNSTIRAGRFFIDFGKQMQIHVHELRTVDRPLVLRTYLGEEVKGDGVQWDDWTPVGDTTVVRWSIGAFASLLPEEVDEVDPTTTALTTVDERKDFADLNFTARLTGFTDVGEHGIFQLGASARLIPDYTLTYEPSGDAVTDLSNTVYGIDATYGWTDDTGLKKWTFGAEFLLDTGDTGSSIVDVGGDGDPSNDTVNVLDDTIDGYYGFVDYEWSRFYSAGVQYSAAELLDGNDSDASELVAYFTRRFSEYHRLRFQAGSCQTDAGEDSLRLAIQYTAFVGAHGHGTNW